MPATGVTIATFRSSLGWAAVVWSEELVARVTFGHRTAKSAIKATGYSSISVPAGPQLRSEQHSLIEQLTAYTEGHVPDLSSVRVDISSRTAFAQRVLNQCRQVPWGHTVSYGELAKRCGSPRAARAVGNVMATNPLPLIVPCHRVLGAGGAIGGFSAPSGISMKRRLLALESDELLTV